MKNGSLKVNNDGSNLTKEEEEITFYKNKLNQINDDMIKHREFLEMLLNTQKN